MVDHNLSDDFDFDLEMFEEDEPTKVKTKFARVKRYKKPTVAKYEKAQDLVNDIGIIEKDEHIDCIVSGDFIAGDLIEAYLFENKLIATEIIIGTLSLSEENVDSLKNIVDYRLEGSMGLIVSDFFFSHERKKIVEYIIKELDSDYFTLAVAGIHTKLTLIRTQCGQFITISGSANLRSSYNIEQICIFNNELTYMFHRKWMALILNRYYAKHEMLRRNKLWQLVAAEKVVA